VTTAAFGAQISRCCLPAPRVARAPALCRARVENNTSVLLSLRARLASALRRGARAAAVALCGAGAGTASAAAAPSAAAAGEPPRPTFAPCAAAACHDSSPTASLLAGGGHGSGGGPRRRLLAPPPPADAAGAPSSSSAAAAAAPPSSAAPPDCPPDRAGLGRATWTLLHATAAYYPDAPTPAQRAAAGGLVGALAELYPCAACRAGFAAHVAAHPPATGSRDELAAWACAAHNAVNAELGRPAFDCAPRALDARWRGGGAGARPECGGGHAAAAGGGGGAGAGAGGESAAESLGRAESAEEERE